MFRPWSSRTPMWIALVALCLSALMPTVSRLAAHWSAEPALWASICSSTGTKAIALDGNQTEDGTVAATDVCDYCHLQAHHPAVLPNTSVHLRPLNLRDVAPALFWHAPRPLHAWVSANPRAPPVRA